MNTKRGSDFPAWIPFATVLIIVAMLFLAGISDANGRLHSPGIGSYTFVLLAIAAAIGLVVIRRER
jgi:hypothetical protein